MRTQLGYAAILSFGLSGAVGCSGGLPDAPRDGGAQASDAASNDAGGRDDATTENMGEGDASSTGSSGSNSGSSAGSSSGSSSASAGSAGSSSGSSSASGASAGSSSGGSTSGNPFSSGSGASGTSSSGDGGRREDGASSGSASGSSSGGVVDAGSDGDATPQLDASCPLSCNGTCISPGDVHNCGACANDCAALPNVNSGSASCNTGKCGYTCLAGYDDCAKAGNGCTDSLSQNGNCGVCGVTCSAPTPVCSASGCIPNCTGSTPTQCGLTCTNTQTDPQNCGSCQHACPSAAAGTAACTGGMCGCKAGYTSCSGGCVDTMSDKFNCGSCGNKCVVKCAGGQCVNPVAISSGVAHSCVRLSDGTVACWGDNQYGDVGTTAGSVTAPVAVIGIGTATVVAAGYEDSCAVLSNGTAVCWGANSLGELGDRMTGNSPGPVTVSGLNSASWIATGGNQDSIYSVHGHSCAVDLGSVWCWGSNRAGVFGIGTTDVPDAGAGVPVNVPGVGGATAVAAGSLYSCALLSDGTVKCWGQSTAGQYSLSPSPVPGLSGGVVAIAGSQDYYDHVCALVSGGTVKCWGENGSGQLGNGTTTRSSTALAVVGLNSASAIAAGAQNSCAIISGGAVQCWGDNSYGQLGIGIIGKPDAGSPTTVSGLTGATAISAGGNFSCAILSSGEVECWGTNNSGQLGNGTMSSTPSPTPVQVAW